MAEFIVTQERLFVRAHPNADSLELANVGTKDGYQVVVGKGEYKTGNAAIYVPEGTVVPAALLEELGLTGRLSGPKKNVVKAIRLRGQISQGLLISQKVAYKFGATPGSDIATTLGLTKFKPEVPVHMSGKQIPAPDLMGWVEIESLKKYPKVFTEGEPVVVTEKVHGTCMIAQLDVATGELSVSSKGVAKSGLSLARQPLTKTTAHSAKDRRHIKRAAFYGKLFLRRLAQKHLNQVKPQVTTTTEQNLYWRVADAYHIKSVLAKVAADFEGCTKVAVYGEVFGEGVQSGFSYGMSARGEKPGFAAFDLRVGYQTGDQWLPANALEGELPLIPVLYTGPYSRSVVEALASGMETISGQSLHMREGVVVRPVIERYSPVTKGRAIVKCVSDDYLLRGKTDKGEEPTEYS